MQFLMQAHQQSRLELLHLDEFEAMCRGTSATSHSQSISGGQGDDEFAQEMIDRCKRARPNDKRASKFEVIDVVETTGQVSGLGLAASLFDVEAFYDSMSISRQ